MVSIRRANLFTLSFLPQCLSRYFDRENRDASEERRCPTDKRFEILRRVAITRREKCDARGGLVCALQAL